jgi:hypothetical protein
MEKEHPPKERIFEIAVRDDLLFTIEEFNHLKKCPECFKQWTAFINDQSAGRDTLQ